MIQFCLTGLIAVITAIYSGYIAADWLISFSTNPGPLAVSAAILVGFVVFAVVGNLVWKTLPNILWYLGL